GSTVIASREAGEPNHDGYPGVASIWWTWSAPAAGRAFITTIGNTFPALLGAYSGTSLASLSSVMNAAYPRTNFPGFSFGNFDIAGPATYQIAADGESGQPHTIGGVDLGVIFYPQPANDNFNNRTPLNGTFLVLTGSVVAASQQVGEIVNGQSSGLRTLW